MPRCVASLLCVVDRVAPPPEEALGLQPLVEDRGDDCCDDEPVARTTPNMSPELSVLLSALGAEYTLVYSERKANGSERASLQSTAAAADIRGFSRERGDGGVDDDRGGTSTAIESVRPKAKKNTTSTTPGAGEALGGIDLVLVERAGCRSGMGPKGLLEEAMRVLRDECGGGSGDVVGRPC